MSRRIAILGAGPTGLEAALAASELGLPFTLYESSTKVAGYVRDWGHVRLFSPWSLDVSARARRLLAAAGHEIPDSPTECPTGAQLVERVFAPLAALPAIAPHLRTRTTVLAIGRQGLVKSDEIGTGRRADRPFRLLVAGPEGEQRVESADVVLDCTGTWGHPNALGDGGIPAPGEADLDGDARLVRRIPDLTREAEAWAGREILVVGSGHSAQTAVRDLAALAAERPGTRVIWAVRNGEASWKPDPDDPLPERARLVREARDIATAGSPVVSTVFGVVVDRLAPTAPDGRLAVTLRRRDGASEPVEVQRIEVDRVLSLTGAVGDAGLYRQLQVHECYATSGLMKLAAALLGSAGGDCLDQESHGVETLVSPEPGFFVLGSKSYGRNNTFLMRVGWQQVDEVFELLADSTS
jgi:cation diffusion facilitator CzcD-associated flavoprotein CzcO